MDKLIKSTAAYRTFSNDVKSGKLSHAYMLYFDDAKNLRAALKMFALEFFGTEADKADGRRILSGSFTDCRIYPDEEGKKLTAETVSQLLEDSVLRPVERSKKLYIISNFEQTSALLQNKLLKTLEEPLDGVHFILGVTSLAPVLDTVKSRVKLLTIAPFTESEIFSALQRKGDNPLNADAAKNCGGCLGAAENMAGGGWFGEIVSAAAEICAADNIEKASAAALKYGDTKYKTELLGQIRLNFRAALGEKVGGYAAASPAQIWQTHTLIYALERADKACGDLKFNAFFQGLLYDLMLGIIEENDRWLKLRA